MSTDVSLDSSYRPRPGGNRKGSRRRFGTIRRLPSKRYQAFYTAPDGQQQNAPTTFQTKGDAEAWLSMQQSRIIEHRWRPSLPASSARTLGSYAEAWLADRELKPRTRAEYRRMLGARILPTLGEKPLSGITPADIRTWYAGLDPNRRTARAHSYALLRTILGTAMQEELLDANPCRVVGAGAPKRTKIIRPATLAELTAIAEAMPAKYRLMVVLASWCALRYGELAELRRSDLDLAAGVIRVRRAVSWSDGQPIVGLPKSDAGARDVHIPPHLLGLIRQHVHDHAASGRDGLLFPNANGDHLHHGSLYKVFKPARLAAGRPDLRWHDLRHTGAVFAAQSGATVRELMERLGHSSPGMALHYQHVAEGRSAEIARRLSEMAKGGVA